MNPNDQDSARGFLQSRRGQLTLYIAAIIILLFFVFTYFQYRALEESTNNAITLP